MQVTSLIALYIWQGIVCTHVCVCVHVHTCEVYQQKLNPGKLLHGYDLAIHG